MSIARFGHVPPRVVIQCSIGHYSVFLTAPSLQFVHDSVVYSALRLQFGAITTIFSVKIMIIPEYTPNEGKFHPKSTLSPSREVRTSLIAEISPYHTQSQERWPRLGPPEDLAGFSVP